MHSQVVILGLPNGTQETDLNDALDNWGTKDYTVAIKRDTTTNRMLGHAIGTINRLDVMAMQVGSQSAHSAHMKVTPTHPTTTLEI
jgi:hypothetical protein